ncbi:MAG TPA: riboflavin synthase [Firmicutes bacterium]|jgi:riboflavin synthase|nr:riboflavin synthase [Bacillota bacterium]
MFTGLVEEIGRLQRRESFQGGLRLVISAGQILEDLAIGDSVAVNGVCLTVTELSSGRFAAAVAPETLRRSNLGQASPGDPLNLERALPLGGRLGGHFVSGHVDATGILAQRRTEGNAIVIYFTAPAELHRYLIPKGSIAVDGVSLTIAALDREGFSVSLIPHSAEKTTLGQKKRGDPVNLEVDMIGKYIERLLAPYLDGRRKGGEKLTAEILKEYGFI